MTICVVATSCVVANIMMWLLQEMSVNGIIGNHRYPSKHLCMQIKDILLIFTMGTFIAKQKEFAESPFSVFTIFALSQPHIPCFPSVGNMMMFQ